MKSLGPCRETKDQQYDYLLNLATRFQSTTFLAVAANYGTDDLFDQIPELRLATAVVDRNKTFANDIWKRGHTMTFSQGSESHGNNGDEVKEPSDADAEDSDDQSYCVRRTGSDPELDDILHEGRKVPAPKPTGIIAWLDKTYTSARGFELGTFDASLLRGIWKKQSANWNDLALGYVSDIVSVVHEFILALISAICEDARIQSALMSVLMDGLIERYRKSLEHAEFILHVEKLGTPLTENHYFADNLEKW